MKQDKDKIKEEKNIKEKKEFFDLEIRKEAENDWKNIIKLREQYFTK